MADDERPEEITSEIKAIVDDEAAEAEASSEATGPEKERPGSRILRLTKAAVNADMTFEQATSVLNKLDGSLDRLEPLLDRFERVVTGLERITNTLEWIFAPALKMRDRREERRARKGASADTAGDADGSGGPPDDEPPPRKSWFRRRKAA